MIRQSSKREKKPPRPPRFGIARTLSKLGYCSRSQAAELVRSGRVTLNGTTVRDPEHPVPPAQGRIEVDGQPVAAAKKIYIALNKPRGLVSTASDEKDRETIYSCLPKDLPWMGPVGRLDKASEGLLLLTNDSEWAARITAPETHLDKTYHVRVDAAVDDRVLASLAEGIQSDGELLRAKSAHVVRGGGRRCWIEIVLDEGKNRHIRRMFEALGIEVLRLVRVAIGPLTLGNLPKGGWRSLTSDEKRKLDSAMKEAGETAHRP